MISLLKNRYTQLALTLILGISLGVVFYPTSHIEEKYKAEYELKETEIRNTHITATAALIETLQKEETSHKSYKEETTKKIQTLVTENTTLKSSIKKKKFKIVKPDGTVVEEEFEESSTESSSSKITEIREEFNKKISEIEDRWKKVHEERIAVLKTKFDEEVKKIREESKTVEQTTTTDTNKKYLGLEGGMTTEKDYYAHGTYTLFGPVFLGAGISGTEKHFGDARFGLGISL